MLRDTWRHTLRTPYATSIHIGFGHDKINVRQSPGVVADPQAPSWASVRYSSTGSRQSVPLQYGQLKSVTDVSSGMSYV